MIKKKHLANKVKPKLQSRVPLACSLSFVVGVAFAVVSDVLSAPRFLVDVFFPSLFTLNFMSVFSL